MLFIIVGTTVEMGTACRQYLAELGFERIEKRNCRIGEALTPSEPRSLASREEVQACDFVYENAGYLIGFNKAQILEAVQGRKNCLLTLTTGEIDFIWQIKAAYGDYVTVLGTYIDETQLTRMFAARPDYSEVERRRRVEIGREVHRNLLEHRRWFDEILIYSPGDVVFGLDGLRRQLDDSIRQAVRREREMNNRRYVELPYVGGEPYLFISYAHLDREWVYAVMAMLQRSGYRLWYDTGIPWGENWRHIVASKIAAENCQGVLLFSSVNSAVSSHVSAEINAALNCSRRILTLRMDDAVFKLEHEMYLKDYQILYADADDFEARLLSELPAATRADVHGALPDDGGDADAKGICDGETQ